MHQKSLELIAFIAVLATGVLLIALGITPESLTLVTVALTGLYMAWRDSRPGQHPPARSEHSGPEEGS